MAYQTSPSDIISSLPPNIIEAILTFLPMRDAFTTSILSHNWRHRCVNIPKLVFDDTLFQGSTNNQLSIKCKLLHVVYPVLLLHRGPILDFSLSISQLLGSCEIDQIILHLVTKNTLQKFTLGMGAASSYKLPSSFFSIQHLTHLKLRNCAFPPPTTLCGFSKLTSLYLENVTVTAKMLLRFLSNCPLLRSFTLIEDANHFAGGVSCDFVELFECLPLVEHLDINGYSLECFAAGMVLRKLPTPLLHLRVVNLSGLSFVKEGELSSALLIITSSPNIEKITMQMCHKANEGVVSETAMNFIERHDYSYVTLDRLCVLEITNFTYSKPGLEFVRLILAKSSTLKKVRIAIDNQKVSVNDEVRILRDLLRYPHASTKAEIIFERSICD